MSSWRTLILVALLTVLAVPAQAGRTGTCPYRAQANFQMLPRDHWAYEAVWELARGSRVLGTWDDQRTLEAFSQRRFCRFHFAKLTARILKHRAWRRRGASLTPARLERLAALVAEFRWDFAMMGGRPERLDLMFAQVLREEQDAIADAAPVRMIMLCENRRPGHPRHHSPVRPVALGFLALFAAAALLQRMERRSIMSTSLMATRMIV